MYNLGEKVKKRRKELNISQQELADKLGYTNRSSITKIEKGNNDIPRSKVEEIADVLQTTPAYLMGWEDEPKSKSILTKFKTMTHKVSVYGRIPAGVPFEAIQDCLDDVTVPDKIAKKQGLFGLKIVGDSMDKVLPNKSIGIFQQCCEVSPGEVAAVMVNGDDATVKHFTKTLTGCILEPNSSNPEHQPLFITEGNPDVRIIGKLVWYCMDPSDIK